MTDAATAAPSGPGWVARIGLAIARPSWALAVANDRHHAGRSGSDLIALIGVLLAATQLRGLVGATWLGSAIGVSFGMRAATGVLTRALTIDLAVLVIGAFVLFAAAGPRRRLGRAFDLACVAAVPLFVVDLVAVVVVRAIGLEVPPMIGWMLTAVAFGWCGALLALAWRPARQVLKAAVVVPTDVVAPARRAGWLLIAVAAIGAIVQVTWIVQHADLLRPMRQGDAAPAFALPAIGPGGVLGAPITLASEHGRVVVLDFWATWCGPCLAALPRLDAIARRHPELVVLAIDLDDPKLARALFDERGYSLGLVADDGDVSQRYGVTTIPHTVAIDRSGAVREVLRGGDDLDAEVTALLQRK